MDKEIPLDYQEPEWSSVPPPNDPWSLQVLKDGSIIETIPLHQWDKSFITLGRLPVCNIPMEHASISRYHAVFQYNGDDYKWYVMDLGSVHGSELNKIPLPKKRHVPLSSGHMLRFGGSTRWFIVQGPSNQEETAINDPVQRLAAWLKERNLKADYEYEKDEDEMRASIELVIEGFEMQGYGIGRTKNEAQQEAATNIWLQIESWMGRRPPSDDGNDDEFYDRTSKRQRLQEEDSVHTFESLNQRKNDLLSQLADLDKIDDEMNVSQVSQEDDELDAYMDELKSSLRMQEMKSREKRREEIENELKELGKLISLVQPSNWEQSFKERIKLVGLEEKKKKKEQEEEKNLNKDNNLNEKDLNLKQEEKNLNKDNNLNEKDMNLKQEEEIFNKDKNLNNLKDKNSTKPRKIYTVELPPEINQEQGTDWMPPSNQKGDGRTNLNEKFGY